MKREINVREITPTAKDVFEAIEFQHKAEQSLIAALHLIIATEENNKLDEVTSKRVNEFLNKYTTRS